MGRLVRMPKPPSSTDLSFDGFEGMLRSGRTQPEQTRQPADNYLERVAKYVPAEVIGFFIVINAILDQAARTGGKTAAMAGFSVMSIAVGVFIAAMALTPLFIWYVREEGDAWVTNAVVSTLAFPFWAYAVGAVAFTEYHDGNLAVILLAIFTVVSGLVSPPLPRLKNMAKQQSGSKDKPHLVDASEFNRVVGFDSPPPGER